jgi:hypothetical protein
MHDRPTRRAFAPGAFISEAAVRRTFAVRRRARRPKPGRARLPAGGGLRSGSGGSTPQAWIVPAAD